LVYLADFEVIKTIIQAVKGCWYFKKGTLPVFKCLFFHTLRTIIMTNSIPENTLIVIADGEHALLFRNVAKSGIKLEAAGSLLSNAANDSASHGASRTPSETSPHEQTEAGFAHRIAAALYDRVHKDSALKLVLIADPQTLGQIRPNLHKEVTGRIVLELPKTLTRASIADIEKTLTAAWAA
jgi:protein required for attachment to host cells